MSNAFRVVFAGTPDFAVPPLEALIREGYDLCAVYTQPDRPAGRGRRLTPSPAKLTASRHGIPIRQPGSLRSEQEQAELRDLRPDVMVVAAYGLILPRAILEAPRLGCINIHASLLPRWRGAAPIQRAILAGDIETGITLMQMDPGLDTGPILAQARCPIEPRDTAQTLHDRLAVLGARVLVENLPVFARGDLSAQPQDDALATYARKLDKAEAALDWSQSAAFLERQVRAFNPWPVAFTSVGGKPLRIWEALAINDSASDPGSILRASREGIDVATGKGTLRLLKLQLPGGRPVAAGEFLSGHHLDDARLGSNGTRAD